MQSSNGKNQIEFDTELNRVVFFSGKSPSLLFMPTFLSDDFDP